MPLPAWVLEGVIVPDATGSDPVCPDLTELADGVAVPDRVDRAAVPDGVAVPDRVEGVIVASLLLGVVTPDRCDGVIVPSILLGVRAPVAGVL